MRIVHNQHFFHKAYNMPYNALNCIVGHSQASMLKMPCNGSLSAYKCSIPIYRKITIERHFENFRVNIQANTLQPKSTAIMVNCIPDNFSKFTKSVKKHILYLFNCVKGKCMSIIYQFDCRVLSNRLQSDTFCNTKRIYFTECKYGNLQSDFPVISKNRV
jgi:hypothetical protein